MMLQILIIIIIMGLKEYLKSVVKATPILPKKGPVRDLSALLESEEEDTSLDSTRKKEQ